jgi:EAL domain-containing protein (putative c-di-GMP-specific phosphodiesterase class I)
MRASAPMPIQFQFTVADLERAFENDEFHLVFQPKVDLSDRKVTGVETFVRWHHPKLGVLPPGLFLDFVEREGRAGDLSYFVLAKGIMAAAAWRRAGRDWSLSVNVSPADLMDEEFCSNVRELARSEGVPSGAIIIEAPERALANDAETILATLDDLRAAGFQVALDGGGVVPVDLARFQPVPFTSIKVGGQAMLRLAERLGLAGAGAISARLRFARAEGLETVAVGAESEATLARLQACGFTAAQGIWIQRPLPFVELMAWDGTWARESGAQKFALEKPIAVAAAVPVAPPAPEPAPEPVKAASAPRRTRLSPEVLAKLKSAEPGPLMDVVEDNASTESRGSAEVCVAMAHLVQRKPKANGLAAPRSDAARRSSILDPVFG